MNNYGSTNYRLGRAGSPALGRLIDDAPDQKQQYKLMKHLEADFLWVSHHSGPASSRTVSVVGVSAVSDSDQDLGSSVR
jgi:hypothetical protein